MNIDPNEVVLKKYLEDIRHTKPISREEEQSLFRLLAKGNELAREKLVSSNMRFVLKVALQYRGSSIPLPDLVNEGSMGLIRAIESFDPSRGLKFISYAVWWIKAFITRAINETGTTIRIPANQHLRIRKALKDRAFDEDMDEDIRQMIQLGTSGISIDAPVETGSKTTLSDILADTRATNPECSTEISKIEGATRIFIDSLPKKEAQVLAGLYGIGLEVPMTLREVGESMNISHERVRQLRDQGLRRIRKIHTKPFLKEKFESYLDAKPS
jgi:RNA polymerase primary sigma factor